MIFIIILKTEYMMWSFYCSWDIYYWALSRIKHIILMHYNLSCYFIYLFFILIFFIAFYCCEVSIEISS